MFLSAWEDLVKVSFKWLTWLLPVMLLSLSSSFARSAQAGTFSPDDQMIVSSRLIITGRVLSMNCSRDDHRVFTYVTVRVLENLKGDLVARKIVLKQEGGQFEDQVSVVFGAPRFSVGEKVLLFLDTWPDGSLRVHDMFLGKFSVLTDPDNGTQRAEQAAEEDGVIVRPTDVNYSGSETVEFSALAQTIRERVAAYRKRSAQFQVQYYSGVPLLSNPPEYQPLADRGALQAQFTTFSQTQPPRWFEPDSGQSIVFSVNPDGAPNPQVFDDVSAAMNAWSTVPGSTLAVSASQGSGCPDKIENTIVFNNCDHRFAPSEDGCSRIIALGILSWTTGVSKQVSGTTFYKATSASVTFNPYSSCSFTDHCVVQEIATHELGHALGFGHSANPDATMYSFAHFDGRCATLRQDDQDAANFSYPLRDPGPVPFQITTPSQLPNAPAGVNYVQVFSAAGGTRPYIWAWAPTQGRLPTGLTFYSSGILGGKSSELGSATFAVDIQDAAGTRLEKTFSIAVVTDQPQYDSKFTTQTVPAVVQAGQPFTVTMKFLNVGQRNLDAFSGMSLVSQNPPNNVTWGTDRVPISGAAILPSQTLDIRVNSTAPFTPGTYTYQWQLFKEGLGFFGQPSTTASIRVLVPDRPVIGGTGFFNGQQAVAFSGQMTAIGGKPPYTWYVAGGTLPPGVVLNSATGGLSGSPTASGAFAATIQAVDTTGQAGQKQIVITVLPPPVSIESVSSIQSVKGTAFSFQMRANGGYPAYVWSVTGGALPAGLLLDSGAGVISGTPATIGIFNAGITVRDQTGQTATTQLQIRVLDPDSIPTINRAKYKAGRRKLIVSGANFDRAAVLYLDGIQQTATQADGRFAVKPVTLTQGQHQVRVINAAGEASQLFAFTVN
jgi:putative Ig domain-containing protein/matrixin